MSDLRTWFLLVGIALIATNVFWQRALARLAAVQRPRFWFILLIVGVVGARRAWFTPAGWQERNRALAIALGAGLFVLLSALLGWGPWAKSAG